MVFIGFSFGSVEFDISGVAVGFVVIGGDLSLGLEEFGGSIINKLWGAVYLLNEYDIP